MSCIVTSCGFAATTTKVFLNCGEKKLVYQFTARIVLGKESYWVHCICMYVSTGDLTSGLDSIGSSTPADTQKKAVEGLISRLLPLRSHQFNITIDSSIGPANRDTFIVRLNHLIVYISIYMHISAIFLFCKFIYQFCISHWCYTTILLGCMEPPLIANCFEMIFQLG